MNAYALNNLSASMWEGKPNPCRFLPSLPAYLVALADVIAVIILVVLPCILIMQLLLPFECFANYLIIPHKARASPTSRASLKFFSTRCIFPMENDSIPQKVFDRYWHHNKNWYVDILHDNYDICIALCLWLLHGFRNFIRLISCKIFCIDCWFRLNWGES